MRPPKSGLEKLRQRWRIWLRRSFRKRPKKKASPARPFHDPQDMEDPRDAIAFGNRIIFLGLGGFFAWASLAPIDEGVPTTGTVMVESHRKVVSHLTGGTLAEIRVQENQQVKEGDVLVVMDTARAKTSYDSAVNEYVAAGAKLARLMAEQVMADKIIFPEEIESYADQVGRRDFLVAQEQLFRIRRQSLQGELAILHENLAASGGQVHGARQQLAARTQQTSLLSEEIRDVLPLVKEGYAPRNRLLEQERQLAELSSVTSELQARITRESSSSAEIRLRIVQRRQDFLKEVEGLVADARREVASLREKLTDARLELDRAVVRAPVAGQVIALQVQTPGGVVTPGSRLMEIIPHDERLLLDLQIPTNVISRVAPGLVTQIRVAAFSDEPQLTIEGKVLSISTDRHEPAGGSQQPPYYLARVEITEKGRHDLKDRQLIAGMSVDAVVKTGERNFLAYLMRPVTKRMFTTFQEP